MLKLPRLPSSSADRFHCEFYKCNLFGSECVKRQTTTREWRGASAHSGQFQKKYVPAHLQHCASGECQQGKEVAAIVGDVETTDVKEERRRIATEAGLATIAAIEKKLEETPAPPAEEETVAEAIEEEKGQACADCGKNVRRGRDGKTPERCFKCRLKAGEVSGRKGKPPRNAKKTPTLREVAKRYNGKTPLVVDAPYKGPVKPDDDVLILLHQKRQHHVDQVARIDKALEALG